jgi:hypothetical protein
MKSMLRGLALAVALIVPAVSQAEFVMDNFGNGTFGNTSPDATGVTRTGVLGTGGYSPTWLGSLLQISGSNNPAGYFEYTLNFAGGVPAPILGYNHWLALRTLAVVGTWNVTLTATGTGGSTPGEATYVLADGSGDATLNLTALSDVGNLNGLNSLTVRYQATAPDSNGNRTLTIGQMAAVPEPASMLLLGSTAIGGLIYNRRRKKALAV